MKKTLPLLYTERERYKEERGERETERVRERERQTERDRDIEFFKRCKTVTTHFTEIR